MNDRHTLSAGCTIALILAGIGIAGATPRSAPGRRPFSLTARPLDA